MVYKNMREINVARIKETVRDLCLKANFELRRDVLKAIKSSLRHEKDGRAKKILKSIIENAKVAKKKRLAICQDTGFAVVHLEIGQDVSLVGGDLTKAVDDGVEEAYRKGRFRKSIVHDPLIRVNTKTNTPSAVSIDIVPGDKVKVMVGAKGSGSENKSRIKMLNPTASVGDIKEFVIETVKDAGPAACPPFVLGIGIGGTIDKAVLFAKKALFRQIDKPNPKRHIAKLERELLHEINDIGMGPMGLGGKTTVLGVNIMECPTHITCLPVAVNINCHVTRSAEKTI